MIWYNMIAATVIQEPVAVDPSPDSRPHTHSPYKAWCNSCPIWNMRSYLDLHVIFSREKTRGTMLQYIDLRNTSATPTWLSDNHTKSVNESWGVAWWGYQKLHPSTSHNAVLSLLTLWATCSLTIIGLHTQTNIHTPHQEALTPVTCQLGRHGEWLRMSSSILTNEGDGDARKHEWGREE